MNAELFCASIRFSYGVSSNLGTETEIKIKIEDPESFCRRLQELGTRVTSARHFEDNSLLDFPDKRLQLSQRLIRVRSAGGQGFLTYKGPPRPEGAFKVREELEINVGDSQRALQILERLGMRICFRYQKYRREFALDDVAIAVDETPVGNFAEFEGSESGIVEVARRMGIDSAEFLRASYYSLYVEFCERTGDASLFMTFK
jgi:adenylate cyclase, class 2